MLDPRNAESFSAVDACLEIPRLLDSACTVLYAIHNTTDVSPVHAHKSIQGKGSGSTGPSVLLGASSHQTRAAAVTDSLSASPPNG